MASIRPWGISKPASEKENKKNNLSTIINMLLQTLPSLSCFHQNSHTRVAGFHSEGWEKAEVIKAVAGNNRKQKGRKRGSTSPGFERKRNSPGELGDVGPHIFVVSFVHPKA